jgi:hypothetical protein
VSVPTSSATFSSTREPCDRLRDVALLEARLSGSGPRTCEQLVELRDGWRLQNLQDNDVTLGDDDEPRTDLEP